MSQPRYFLILIFLSISLFHSGAFSYVTVLGKGDAALCYQAAKFGYSNKSSLKYCFTAIDDVTITKRNLYATYVNIGIIYNNSKKPDEAIKFLNKGLENDRTRSESMLSLGNSSYLKRNYQEALEYYDKSAEEGLKDISAVYFNKGLVYEKLNNVNLAVEYYKKALNLKPKYSEYFEKRARLMNANDWNK